MSTRSDIIVALKDGTFARVYCHSDGYPSYNGLCLQTFYNSYAKASALIRLGDLSSLGPRIKPNKGEAHSFDNRAPGVTVAYKRDRKEKDVAAHIEPTLAQMRAWLSDTWGEYAYLYQDGKWFLMEGKKLTPLATVLSKIPKNELYDFERNPD